MRTFIVNRVHCFAALLGALLLSIAMPGCVYADPWDYVPRADVASTQKMVDQQSRDHNKRAGVLLDPRDPAEFAAGHISGAINIPYTELKTRTSRLDGSNIIVYANDAEDWRAKGAARRLQELGYKKVSVLGGGLKAWTSAGYSVEAGS